ncbi:MAG: FtsW/RodA/SpoVE family cell cycle protein [Lachnospiraceae bacterium]|nr:FtsW/RodA/SpoVE family cell cycle protein [Lachnospiraceae bacterium]
MQTYVVELSKYFIVLCMLLYTYESFSVFRFTEEKRRRGIYTRQSILLFFIQFFCFLSLCIRSGRIEYIIFYAFVQMFLFSCIFLTGMIYRDINRLLLNNMCLLLGTGFVVLARISLDRAIRQFVIVCICYAICLAIPYIVRRDSYLPGLGWVYGLGGIFALSVVLITSEATSGSKIIFSFTFIGLAFQPSEFVKILFVLMLAAMLWKDSSFKRVCFAAAAAAAHVVILAVSRDLGGALIFFVTFVLIVFLATGKYLYLLAGAAGACGASALAYLLFSHVRVRVLAWWNPWEYIDTKGYQIAQSLFSIGSGSWFGMGLGGGTPDDIPKVGEDFIFSAVCEELGVLFGICLLLVCISCFVMMMCIAVNAKERFFQLTVWGIGVMYAFQIFLTIGGGVKFIPLTGVTLPFVSYGGSSVTATIIMFSLIQGVALREKKSIEKNEWLHASRPAAGVTYAFGLLFLVMTGYLSWFTATGRQDMLNNSYNSRQEILMRENYRGTVFSADGQILAQAVLDESGEERRNYPFENLFAHVVGYSTRGRTGIEKQANYYLINSDLPLAEKVENEIAGRKNPGNSVYTTLDAKLQETAAQCLNGHEGAIVITEPSTGKILAMVSSPDFDPNKIADIWDDLLAEENNSALLNRVTQGKYPPGEIFELFTALEYIRENPEKFQDTLSGFTFEDLGNADPIRDWERFAGLLEDLLFNQKLPVAFDHAESLASPVMDTDAAPVSGTDAADGDNVVTAAGEQWKVLMTPLHLNMITSAIADGGLMMKPYVIDRIETSAGGRVKTFTAKDCGRIMTNKEAAALTGMMIRETEDIFKGTYAVAGKQGIVEYNSARKENTAWFTGFAPAEDPRICVTIIIEGTGKGSSHAVTAARQIFDAYFPEPGE